MTGFQESVIALDAALTGRSYETAAEQLRSRCRIGEFTPKAFRYGDSYYMSDGGFSRLVCDDEDGSVFLSFVSNDQVKAAWDACQALVEAVEAFTKPLAAG